MLKKVILFLVLLPIVLLSCKQDVKKPINETVNKSTYYFIRHAEKDRSDSTNKDPHLTDIGLKRAEKWASKLGDISFDAVYSTNYNRTKETATPLALKNNLDITLYNPNDIDYNLFLDENKGKNVLVVGHSNTTPTFVNKILGQNKYEDIDDNQNGNLYIITIENDKIFDELKVIN